MSSSRLTPCFADRLRCPALCRYENANVPFTNLDKIIEYVNRDGRVTTQYSLPSTYIHAKHAENLTWTTKTDDFFPCQLPCLFHPIPLRSALLPHLSPLVCVRCPL